MKLIIKKKNNIINSISNFINLDSNPSFDIIQKNIVNALLNKNFHYISEIQIDNNVVYELVEKVTNAEYIEMYVKNVINDNVLHVCIGDFVFNLETVFNFPIKPYYYFVDYEMFFVVYDRIYVSDEGVFLYNEHNKSTIIIRDGITFMMDIPSPSKVYCSKKNNFISDIKENSILIVKDLFGNIHYITGEVID